MVFSGDLEFQFQENAYSITSFDIQKYVDHAEETICKTIEEIITISPELQTFANTLRPWNRLITKLSQCFSLLRSIDQADLPCSVEASRALQDLQMVFSRKAEQSYDLYNTLHNAAEKAVKGLEPLERYIAGRYLQNCPKNFLHLQGSSPEKNNESFTILHLEEKDFPTAKLSDLIEKIAAESADIVCIQKMVSEEEVRTLYQHLQDRYAHFYLYMDPSVLHFPKNASSLLVISKYQLEKLHFNQFKEEENGFFDFVVQCEQAGIGHVYSAHLPSGKCEDTRAIRLWQIVDKIETDFLQEESMPFILCGDLGIVRGCREAAETLLEGSFYFTKEQLGTSYVLYFPPVPGFFNQPDWENTVVTSVVPMFDNYSGLLTTVKGKWRKRYFFYGKRNMGRSSYCFMQK